MLLVDTSAWIEVFNNTDVGSKILPMIPEPQHCLVPTLVQFELIKWINRVRGPSQAKTALAFTQVCIVQPLDTQIAVTAAQIASEHKLSTADAIIYASARLTDTDLLTCDAHFNGLPGVIYIPKNNP